MIECSDTTMWLACPKCRTMVEVPIDMDPVAFVKNLVRQDAAAHRGLGLLLDRIAVECQYLETVRHEGRRF